MTALFWPLPGLLACLTLKLYEKVDDAYGKLTLRGGIILAVVGFLVTAAACYPRPGDAARLLSVLVNVWMLLVTAYMDRRCGEFSVAVLVAGLVPQVVIAAVCLFCGSSPLCRDNGQRYSLIILYMLILMWLCRLATGDCLLWAACALNFLTVCGEYVLIGFCAAQLAANGAALVIEKLAEGIKPRNWKAARELEFFPFTAYLVAGCFFVYFLFLFVG